MVSFYLNLSYNSLSYYNFEGGGRAAGPRTAASAGMGRDAGTFREFSTRLYKQNHAKTAGTGPGTGAPRGSRLEFVQI